MTIRKSVILSLTTILLVDWAIGQDASKSDLNPGTQFRLSFPDLARSLFAEHINAPIQTGAFVQLPENYSSEGNFPIFLYLDGGWGGVGENIEFPRRVIGPDDYIVVNFPLFREKDFDRESYLDGMIVGFDDYRIISSTYKAMLERLHDTIPNIDKSRSIIGGHSNGAKTVSILLSSMDETALKMFRGFLLVDGGFTWSSYCRTNELRNHHVLFVVGGGTESSSSGRKYIVARMKGLREFAEARKMPNWHFKVMPGHEHEFADDYHSVIRDWARGIKTSN